MTDQERGELLVSLKKAEGLRLLPYVDTVGQITIGYGRNLSANGITQEEADAMLQQDLDRHWSDLTRMYPWVLTLDSTRQLVLGEMVFNLGIARLSGFSHMLAAVSHGDYALAAEQMLQSVWASQVGARATRLASAMASGEWKS